LDLSGRVFLITGANSGVGFEVTQFLAAKKATVFMICRSKGRAEQARDTIVETSGNSKVHVIVCDVGLEADVRRAWQEFQRISGSDRPRLDALVCNAGALMNEKTVTSEGVEVTFASHLLFGTYLLGSLALPSLEATQESRCIVVSSGGMYNTAFPTWETATSTWTNPKEKYDGQFAYAYAKRGQVLLCERWAGKYPSVKVVSCHPGWTSTPAVESAYGESKKYLEPMRKPWEGAEGIVWLCVTPAEKIHSGAFYLDRKPQVKHMAGPFFTEGSHTKNTPEEVDEMMRSLEDWSNGRQPNNLAQQAELMEIAKQSNVAPLRAMETAIDIKLFMGKWYVIYNIPTVFDKNTANNVEEYTYNDAKNIVEVDFTYTDMKLTKTSRLKQRANVINEARTEWKLSPKVGVYLPVGIPYLVADCAPDYSTCIIGIPDRSYVWIMAREPQLDAVLEESLVNKAQALGYDPRKLNRVLQKWDQGQPPLCEADEPLESQ